MTDHWLILRTSGRNTLKLAEQLVREGFHAWAPKRTFFQKGKGEMLTVTAPLLPSFAFARAEHIHSLLAMADDPVKPCVDFSVFRDDMHPDRIPLIRDGELHHLRLVEAGDLRRLEVGMAKRRKPILNPGDSIRLTSGAFAGMVGTVERDSGKYIEVDLGLRSVKICAFHLGEENVSLAA